MMRLILKAVDVAGDYLSDHKPENLKFFSLNLTATIGPPNQDGGSLYYLHVCTPEWLKYSVEHDSKIGALWGRHLLIVDSFDADKIESLIQSKLDDISNNFSGNNPVELSERVARYAHWEFEDYQPNT